MFTTVGEYHNYMNQLYEVATKNGFRCFYLSTGPSDSMAPHLALPSYRTPNNEPVSGGLVGSDRENLVYRVSW